MLGFPSGSRDSRSPQHLTSTIVTPLVLNVAACWRTSHRRFSPMIPLLLQTLMRVGPLLSVRLGIDV